MFGREVLKPDLRREPVYDSVYNRDGRWQSFVCAQCGTPISLDLEHYVGDGEDPEGVLGPAHEAAVREHFGILEKSLENGWPYIRVEVCANCGASYLVYVAVFEPRNGWCQGVLQGITEWVPSSDPPRRLDAERKRQLKALGKAEVERRSAELQAALDAANPAPSGSDEWGKGYRKATLRERWLRKKLPIIHKKRLEKLFVVVPESGGDWAPYMQCKHCGSVAPTETPRRLIYWGSCRCGNIKVRRLWFWHKSTIQDPSRVFYVKLIGKG
jgi:hypothetical protein